MKGQKKSGKSFLRRVVRAPGPRPFSRWVALALLAAYALAGGTRSLGDGLVKEVKRQYGAAAGDRILAWERLMLEHRNDTEGEKVRVVNAFFNRVKFVSDIDHWGRPDYWATPLELLASSAGDCEDYSIAKYFTLKELGVPVERLRLTYVKAVELRRAHMVLAYYPAESNDPLILDNLEDGIERGSARSDLVPVYSFNGDGLWLAVARGRGRRIGSAQGLALWRDLSERMDREVLWRS